jgi:hypothetical protein
MPFLETILFCFCLNNDAAIKQMTGRKVINVAGFLRKKHWHQLRNKFSCRTFPLSCMQSININFFLLRNAGKIIAVILRQNGNYICHLLHKLCAFAHRVCSCISYDSRNKRRLGRFQQFPLIHHLNTDTVFPRRYELKAVEVLWDVKDPTLSRESAHRWR